MSKQSLSKGTLGLKFMNRTIPPSSPQTQTPPVQSSSTSTTASPAALTPQSGPSANQSRDQTPSVPVTASQSAPTPRIIHDSSLLSFPILSSSASSFSSSNLYYNSMPLTSTAISGRRSFGGANIEIERLNDPSSHQPKPVASSKEGGKKKEGSSSQKKKQRQNEPVSTRRTDMNNKRSNTSEKPQIKKRRISEDQKDLDEKIEMNSKWEGGEDEVSFSGGFKKPSGYEGAKSSTSSSNKKNKGKGNGLMDLDQHKWGKRGETREWDREKPSKEEYELGSEEEDQRILDGLDQESEEEESESESDEDDEEEIRKMLMSAKALDKKRSTTSNSREKKELIEKDIRREEEKRMTGESSSGARRKDKGGKKGRK
ncbi:hypothetical protein JCM3765_007148 [Sporobolomyces pararoseus]